MPARVAEQRGDGVGLKERELAAARADPEYRVTSVMLTDYCAAGRPA